MLHNSIIIIINGFGRTVNKRLCFCCKINEVDKNHFVFWGSCPIVNISRFRGRKAGGIFSIYNSIVRQLERVIKSQRKEVENSMEKEQQVEKRPVQLRLRENTLTALLFGEIDHHSAREIREEIDLTAMRVRPAQLVLDFGGVQFMDSSGVGLILGRCKIMQMWQGHVIVQNMPPKLERIVSLAGLTDLCEFRMEDVKDENDE